MSCKRRGLDSGEATEVELASPSCGRRLSVLGAAGAAGAAMVAPAAALESAEDLASGLDRPTRLPVPFHREPDNEMDILRQSLANTPRAQWPKAYLLGVLRHYSMDADTRGYMLISDELHSSASGGASCSCTRSDATCRTDTPSRRSGTRSRMRTRPPIRAARRRRTRR